MPCTHHSPHFTSARLSNQYDALELRASMSTKLNGSYKMLPCRFLAVGSCIKGDKCTYMALQPFLQILPLLVRPRPK
ncbi:hypothetical protein BCR37DRAFT_171578 [Protomyces lactucae-debilis]|uniref:C3H1-type domain-containing protein n=1 Tax=Protomyces lactucae-debilis TaxID=2754530 RepID=A0A1Y2EW14_PROLT|nr:uncharacterized protein BCR37DRAFT_171578 [Protomyces lactucae-debilis]ORY75769.1 hypothetical protein BCR37DRAFT_171578 [Protomyces lactucae-debilis]